MATKSTIPDRLRQARRDAGYATAEDAANSFGWPSGRYRHHENGTRGFDVEAARSYGRAFKVSPGWLLGIDAKVQQAQADGPVEMEVIGQIAAGVWRESVELPSHERRRVTVPPSPAPHARRYLLEVVGDSMNLVYPEGTILDVVSIFDLGVEPEPGDDVIVERLRSDGLRETTAKRFYKDADGRSWLMPQSTNPDHQLPVTLSDSDTDEVRVVGYVVGAYSPTRINLLARLGL